MSDGITDADAKAAGFASASAMRAFYARRSESLKQKNYLTEKGSAGGTAPPAPKAAPTGGGLMGYVARKYKEATGQ